MAGFTTESPSKRFVILSESGRCENLLQALEVRTSHGYRIVQCWGSGGGMGGTPMTFVLLEKVGLGRAGAGKLRTDDLGTEPIS